MEKKHRVFLYDRKEMLVLILLAVMVALFAFTLGVHLGKKVGVNEEHAQVGEATAVHTSPDEVPNRIEIAEQTKGLDQATDQTLNRTLHDEVAKTGIKLDTARAVDLPRDAKSPKAGSTTLGKTQQEAAVKQPERAAPPAALSREAPAGKYTIQIGSFSTIDEAAQKAESLEALGLTPFMRTAEVKGKGKWFRVYAGGFASKDHAEKSGKKYRDQHAIDSFIVTPMP